jgi:sulfide:quinone oxidoreductase
MVAQPPDMTFIAPETEHRLRVLIAGGGVAGVETLLALRALAGPRVAVTLLSPEPDFVVHPTTARAPVDRPPQRRLALADVAADQEAELVRGTLHSVDPAAHLAVTELGARLRYDVLVVAAGARAVDPLAGAVTYRGHDDVLAMRVVLDDLRAGAIRSVVFALPRIGSWPLPLYELALMTAGVLIGAGVGGAELTVVTPEPEPLAVFGAAAGRAMRARLAERGIGLRTRRQPARVEPEGLLTADGTIIAGDRVVTLAILKGPAIRGLPADSRGFLPVDRHGRVRGAGDVYAAGDVTDYPVKHGGLGAQQADAVAEAIAARAGAPVEPAPFRPAPHAQRPAGRYLAPDLDAAPMHGAARSAITLRR